MSEIELNDEQLAVVNADEPFICVKACAAAGKTATIVARVNCLLSKGVKPETIVVITFTNAAAINMHQRIGEKGKNIHIGTVHSFANWILKANNIDTSEITENERFDELFDQVKLYRNAIPYVEHLIIDEVQDCTSQQYEFFEMVNPKNLMLVGDYRQSIYQFLGAVPELFLSRCGDYSYATYNLLNNYRCSRSVLRYAQHIIRAAGRQYYDTSKSMRDIEGKVFEVPVNYDNIAATIALEKYGPISSWFILCRKNQEVADIAEVLRQHSIPRTIIRKSDFTSDELEKALNSDTVKVMTIHQSKGLESPNVCVIGAKFYDLNERCLAYVAATRARDNLVWTTEVNKFKRKSTYLKGDTWEQY